MAGVGMWEFADAIAQVPAGARTVVTATVVRVDEDGAVWCRAAGGGEFPAVRSSVRVAQGDMVSVAIQDGVAEVVGNLTDPSAPATEVDRAAETAGEALSGARAASEAAGAARQLAEAAGKSAADAAAAAEQAQESAASAGRAASAAQESADEAAEAAATADGKAVAAGQAASAAQADATQAKADAATAKSSAESAVADAAEAKASAAQAATDASNAATSAANAEASATAAQGSASTAATAAQQAQSDATAAASAARSAQADAAQAQSDASAAATSASQAATSASNAESSAGQAATSASNAEASASQAATSASNAEASAGQAATSASNAAASASNAEQSASDAAGSASTAQQQATAATTAANEAKADAATAKSQAASAVTDAATAKQAATEATATANGAVTALATVQGVVDQLETDVDELQVHVAMMDAYSDGHGGTVPAGLHVVPTGAGYFLVIANDGTYVYDAQSVLVTKFGESIDFSSTRPQRIGNDTAYVEYYDSDNDGVPDSIRISGTNLNVEIADFRQTVAETYATKAEAKQTDSASGLRELPTEDAAELPMLGLTVHGECAQDGTPAPDAPVEIRSVRGRNLLSFDHEIAGKYTNFYYRDVTVNVDHIDRVELEAGVTYTLSFDAESSVTPFQVSVGCGNGDYTRDIKTVAGFSNGRVRIQFTPTDAQLSGQNVFAFRVPRYNSKTSFTYSISNVSLVVGSGERYEPYGSISVLSHGKNYFDHANVESLSGWTDGAYEGSVANLHGQRANLFPHVPEHCALSFDFNYVGLGQFDNSNGVSFSFGYADGTRKIYYTKRDAEPKRYAFASDPNKVLTDVAFGYVYGGYPIHIANIQLEAGTEATEYEPYRESVSYIDLKGEELDYLDEDYKDTLTIDASGHAVIDKRCGRKSIAERDGSTKYAAGVYTVRFDDMLGQDVTSGTAHSNTHPSLSTRFVHTEGSVAVWSFSAYVGYFTRHTVAAYPSFNHCLFFRIADDLTNTEFCEQYADTEVVYPLAEPRTVDLGYIDLPTTFPNGTVRVVAEIQPVIDGSWWTAAGYEAGKAYGEGNRSADLAALTERVTTAESSITQQAGQIALKVNAADVNTKAETTALLEVKANKDTLTSEINASADTVKIAANRVNIEGAAIFTGSGRLSQSSLDGAYDASGAASTAVGALTADLASSSGTTVIDGGHISTNSLTVGHVSGLQGTLDGKASTAAVESAAKRTYVSIRATAIDYAAGTATLEATLFVDGAAVTSGVTYAWMVDGAEISGAASRTYSVPASSGLEHAFSCKCTATV